jgi:probable 2-oxoglutarate dehydrogenase E1 component DHKTD1
LDLIHREQVAALSPERYGLVREEQGTQKYNVDGIIWTKRVGAASSGDEMWTLEEIERHLKRVYVGNIGHEVDLSSFSFLLGRI